MQSIRKAREISGLAYAGMGYLVLIGTLVGASMYTDLNKTYTRKPLKQQETRETPSKLEKEKIHETHLLN